MVLSSGVKPSGIGWYSSTSPVATLSPTINEDVKSGAREHAAVRRLEPPRLPSAWVRRAFGGLGVIWALPGVS